MPASLRAANAACSASGRAPRACSIVDQAIERTRQRRRRYKPPSNSGPTTSSQPAARSERTAAAWAWRNRGSSGHTRITGPGPRANRWPTAATTSSAEVTAPGAIASPQLTAAPTSSPASGPAPPPPLTTTARLTLRTGRRCRPATPRRGERGQRRLEDRSKRGGAPAHQPDQLRHRGGLARPDLVGVVGDVPDQRVGQLELSAQHRLRTAGLAHRDDAGGGERRDLGRGVEARPVDVAVDPAVAYRLAGALRRRRAAPLAHRPRTGEPWRIQWARAGSPGLDEERAQAAVGQPVGEEVQIAEHDQRAERERRIDRAAGGAADDRLGARAASAPTRSPGG